MKLKYINTAIAALIMLSACNKVMDKQALGNASPELVFSDTTLIQLNLDNIYDNNLPSWGGQNTSSSLSGTSVGLSEEGYASNVFLLGTYSYGTNDVGDFGTSLSASNNWGKIRQINTFIQAVKATSFSQYTINKFVSQALFFRAFRYWDIVRIYGGVPIVLTPLDGVGDSAKANALLPRDKTSDCFAQMVKDLDSAMQYLPATWTTSSNTANWGKITKGAAAALKGRILLYWASPLYNPNDLADRWQAAYNANLQAKTILDASGYGLNASFKNMWFTKDGSSASSYSEPNNPEAVFVTEYNTSTTDQGKKNNGWDKSCRPSYLNGSNSNVPTWEMVRAFPMKDGKAPGASAKYVYSDTFYYKNRDPRFDATIAYSGCTWPLDGNTAQKVWTYYTSTSTSSEKTASNTGFYCRKATFEGTFSYGDPQYSGTDWMEIRYAEVLLNLAEAAVGINKVATSDEGYTGLIAVRKRAGIEAGTDGLYGLTSGMTRSQLFDAILFERRIEFAYEGKRFWDLYRWKKFATDLNGWTRNRLRLVFKAGNGIPKADTLTNLSGTLYRDYLNLDTLMKYNFTYYRNNNHDATNSTTKLDVNPINFLSTYYFFPLPQVAITNNPNLQQNNNWGGGFDPLK